MERPLVPAAYLAGPCEPVPGEIEIRDLQKVICCLLQGKGEGDALGTVPSFESSQSALCKFRRRCTSPQNREGVARLQVGAGQFVVIRFEHVAEDGNETAYEFQSLAR